MAQRKDKKVSRTRRRWENPSDGDKAKVTRKAKHEPKGRRSVKITNEAYALVAELAQEMNTLNLKAISRMPHLKAGYYSLSDVVEWACRDALDTLKTASR